MIHNVDNSYNNFSNSNMISVEEEFEEEEEKEEDDIKINDNTIKNQSSLLDSDKNNSKAKKPILNNDNSINNKKQNNIDIGNKRIIIRNKDNQKKLQDKQTQKSNTKLSPLLSSQKEENKVIKEFKEIVKVDEESKNAELLKKIKDLEEKLSSSNNIINNLNNNKDIVIQKLTKTNKKLQNSLEKISKKLDERLLNTNIFKKLNIKSRQKLGVSFSTNNRNSSSGLYNNGGTSHLSDDMVSKNNIRLKEKELNNAVNMIKILTNDNKKLQNKVDEFEKNQKLEKEQKEKEKNIINKELEEHKACKEKLEKYKEKIRNLSEKNHILQEKIYSIKSRRQNISLFNIKNKNNSYTNNDLNESENDNSQENYKTKKKLFKKSNNSISLDKNLSVTNKKEKVINLKKIGIDLLKQQKGSLPKINTNKNKSNYNLNYNYQINNNINNLFNVDEMQQLNKVFKNNEDLFVIIVKKIEIIQKSKESLNNKFNSEKKQYIERIYSMQQHIDYLNGKIRENELKINILQSQLNENTIHKKQLIKKVKILASGLELNEYNGNKNNQDNINNKTKTDNKTNEEANDNKSSNQLNNNNTNNINDKKKRLNKIRRSSFINALNKSNSLGENIVDNLNNIKEKNNNNQNQNNSDFINEGDTILEENVSESSSKSQKLKLNNEDESEKNSKSFL